MQASISSATLADLRDKVGGADPVPAGVAICAVSASLALALLAKVLRITGGRKDFAGDPQEIEKLFEPVLRESAQLAHPADEDVRAFDHYLECMRQSEESPGRDQGIAAAMHKAIEVPMNGTRSAVRGLGLWADALPMVHGLTASALGIAAALLSGSVRAMLLSVDFNIKEMRSDEQFANATTAERRELEAEALRRARVVGLARAIWPSFRSNRRERSECHASGGGCQTFPL